MSFTPFSRQSWKKSIQRVMRGEKHSPLWDIAGWLLLVVIVIVVEILRGVG
jgi:hypothetical protein